MKPTKSAANIIANNSTAGLPISTDLVLFAPLPNTPLVTPALHCTVAELIAGGSGITGTIAANQVAFGTAANVIGGNAGFTFDPLLFSFEVRDGDSGFFVDWSSEAFGAQSAKAWSDDFPVLFYVGKFSAAVSGAYPGAQLAHLDASGVTAGVKEVDGLRITIQNGTADYQSGIDLNQLVNGTSFNQDVGLFTGTDAFGLLIGDVNFGGGVNNYAIKTGAGLVDLGDSIQLANGKALRTTQTNAHTLKIQGYDVNGAAYVDFVTITNSNTPTFALTPPAGGGIVNIQATDYKSSDGTSGETAVILAAGLVSITVKNGLVVAHA